MHFEISEIGFKIYGSAVILELNSIWFYINNKKCLSVHLKQEIWYVVLLSMANVGKFYND